MSRSRYAGPQDGGRRTAWQRERREVVRHHHPDRGGDPAALQAGLDEVDRRYRALDAGERFPSPPVVVRRRTVRQAARRVVRRGSRRLRATVPRRWAGSRRYIDL